MSLWARMVSSMAQRRSFQRADMMRPSAPVPVQPVPRPEQALHMFRAARYDAEVPPGTRSVQPPDMTRGSHRCTPSWSLLRRVATAMLIFGSCLWMHIPGLQEVGLPGQNLQHDEIADLAHMSLRPSPISTRSTTSSTSSLVPYHVPTPLPRESDRGFNDYL
jgi:hypothetical protein